MRQRRRRRRQGEGHTIGDAPIEEAYRDQMKSVAMALDRFFNDDSPKEKTVGWVLMVFPFDAGPGRCNYMSNAVREDVVTLLKEQIKRFEGQPETVGHT